MALKRIPRRNTQQEEAEKGAFQEHQWEALESEPGYHKPFQWGFTVKISGIQRGNKNSLKFNEEERATGDQPLVGD